MLHEVKKLKGLVRHFLLNFPKTRNSYKELILKVWEFQGLKLTEQQKLTFLRDCSEPEAITRARREYNSTIPPRDPQKRLIEQEKFRKYYKN